MTTRPTHVVVDARARDFDQTRSIDGVGVALRRGGAREEHVLRVPRRRRDRLRARDVGRGGLEQRERPRHDRSARVVPPRSSLASNVPLLVHARVGIPRRSRDLTISRPVLPLAPRTTDGDASAGLDSASDAALVCTRRSLRARGRGGGDALALAVACIAQWLPVTSWLTSLLVISNQIQNVSSLRQEPHVPLSPVIGDC